MITGIMEVQKSDNSVDMWIQKEVTTSLLTTQWENDLYECSNLLLKNINKCQTTSEISELLDNNFEEYSKRLHKLYYKYKDELPSSDERKNLLKEARKQIIINQLNAAFRVMSIKSSIS